jgi:L-threonylcarbamoyladenylate synthase
MKTKIISLSQLTDKELKQTLSLKIPIAFPTETVYGLGAPYDDEETIFHIFVLKGRPLNNPLIVHVSSLEMIPSLVREIHEDAYTLMRAFFPGPLTLIMKKSDQVSSLVTANQDTVGIRMPDHHVARELIQRIGKPLVAPSANISGRPSGTEAMDVYEDFQGKILYIIDGETSDVGIESTIVDTTREPFVVLRPGAITREMIEKVIKKPLATKINNEVIAPGMIHPHYEPDHPLKILRGNDEHIIYYVNQKKEALFIGHERFLPFIDIKKLSLGHNVKEMTRYLYHVLRQSNHLDIQEIYTHDIDDEGYMNRLLKAAKDHIIDV